jgi:hypothetical protein
MKSSALCLLLFAASPACQACSTTTFVDLFEPSKVGTFVDRAADPPSLLVEARVTHRPQRLQGPLDVSVCDNTSDFEVSIRFDALETRQLAEFGYYFRVVGSTERWTSVDSVPLRPEVKDGAARFRISVSDKPTQEPHDSIDVEVEVFALGNDMRIGPTTRFRLHADSEAE